MRPADPLAAQLAEAMSKAAMTPEAVADRTKVPLSTLQALLGEPQPGGYAVLPARAYLRGHLGLAAREIGWSREEALALFDETYPPAKTEEIVKDAPGLKTGSVALAAGLLGVGILAVILAFTG